MTIQLVPVCLKCSERIEGDVVFESICGHPNHPTSCWHPICLMEHREHYADAERRLREFFDHLKD